MNLPCLEETSSDSVIEELPRLLKDKGRRIKDDSEAVLKD
jgi:hypothetical protein